MDQLALSDGFARQYKRTASNGTKTQVYYPSRPRSHSDGSSINNSRKNGVKLLGSFNATGKLFSSKTKSVEEDKKRPGSSGNGTRYKTELCRPYQEYGFCKYGDKCQFAHGEHELRALPRHPKYKTELCRTYHSKGFCPYGPRCHFIHNLEEARQPKESTGQKSPNKTGHLSFSLPPISPSFDSGISSPDDTLGCLGGRAFEFPGSESSGSDEGEEQQPFYFQPNQQAADLIYSSMGEDSYTDLMQKEREQLGSPDMYLEFDTLSSASGSPAKPPSDEFTSDPSPDLSELLQGMSLNEVNARPSELVATSSFPPSRGLSRPYSGGHGSSGGRRLQVFDDMLNSRSDTALLKDSFPPNSGVSQFNLFP